MNTTASNLENQLRVYCKNAGMSKTIVGLSGGVDSAVTFAIAAEALGKENIFPVLMPYKLGTFSSVENFEDAKKLCLQYSITPTILNIDKYTQPFEGIFSEMAFGNTLARIRMTLLFGMANTKNALVLGTCNKSEVMLGYETKFGDGACDISVLGDLWKKEVYELAQYYDLPNSFCVKPPSAELYINQTDEEEMGFSYKQAEPILAQIEKNEENNTRFKPSTELEERIFKLYTISQHKRIMPPILLASLA